MDKSHKIILSLLSLTIFLVVLDSAIVNVALPAIKQGLDFATADLQWVLTAYILTFGGFLMFGGRAADLYGRRLVLVWGIAGFSLFSLLIGFSSTSTMLIVLRALQGLAAAFMAPTALSILLTTFEEGHARNKALSIWSIVASGGGAAGVFLGGVLTQYLGWRSCFFVNVPIGILAIFLILKYVPAHIEEAKDKHLDLPGAVLITVGLMSLVYGLTLATQDGWTATATVTAFGLSIAMIAAFLFNETKSRHPLVPLSIFKIRNVVGGNVVVLPVVAGALGNFYFLSQYIQNVLKFSPVLSGLCFLPVPIIIGVVSYNAPRFLDKFGFKPMIVFGTTLITIGIFWISRLGVAADYLTQIFPAFIILAVGFGIAFVAITVAATTGVPADKSGLASGLINTSQQIGGALGLAVLAVVANATTTAGLASGQSQALATVHGYQQAFFTATVLIAIALLLAILVIKTPKK